MKRALDHYLIDGEADGVEVPPKLPLLAHVFLHQADQKRAAVYSVVGVVIHLIQLYHVLGV